MDSTDNNNANSLSSLPEIPITRISAISDNGSQLEFDQQLSGFMMLNKVNLKYIVNSRQEFSEQLIEANQTISILRKKLAAAETTPSTSGITDMAVHYKMLSDLVQEKQNLANQLAKHRRSLHQKKLLNSF
ncbi:uncharacterized protein LOC122501310 [Leptopilina heterotoma]|uniref:uncharacterized protein LOC122501310 n=1 Tax=Leptopilina heterotoma TaxID=63436 RepID=UPI001CA952F4|nr:uncharacterized protein LOC122501310 [Leptopilina heterotoma]